MAASDRGVKNMDQLIKKLTNEKDKQVKIASDAGLQAQALSAALGMAIEARDALIADNKAEAATPAAASAASVV